MLTSGCQSCIGWRNKVWQPGLWLSLQLRPTGKDPPMRLQKWKRF